MKNVMYVLVAALVMCSMASRADDWKAHKKAIKISVEQAAKDPGLSQAIKDQLPADFLVLEKEIYVAVTKYNNNTYQVYGTRGAWLAFLFTGHIKGEGKSDPKPKLGTD